MTETELPQRLRGAVRREWILIVAAAVIGMVAAAHPVCNAVRCRIKCFYSHINMLVVESQLKFRGL